MWVHPQANRELVLHGQRVGFWLRRGQRKTIGLSIDAQGLRVSLPRWSPLAADDEVVQAIDALHLQQSGHAGGVGALEWNVDNPVADACAKIVGCRHIFQLTAFQDDQIVGNAFDLFHLVRAVNHRTVLGCVAV